MSTIKIAMNGMGYKPANSRPRCGSCAKAEQAATGDFRAFRCKEGGFNVTVYAVCDRHQPQARVPAAPDAGDES